MEHLVKQWPGNRLRGRRAKVLSQVKQRLFS